MATFSVEIADQDVSRVIESLCVNYGWEQSIPDPNDPMSVINNPETKSAFANRMVRKFLTEHVRKYELDILKQTLNDQITPPTITDPQV
jgi:hypothetical protein